MTLRQPTSDFPPPVVSDLDEEFINRQPVEAKDALPILEKGELADLTAQEKEILALAADATFPKGGALNMSGTEAGVPEYFENYFKKLPPDKQKLIHLMLHFVETIPLIFGPERTLFSLMEEENRGKALDFSNKSLYFHRIALQSLRVLLTMGYMANENVRKKIGCVPNMNPFGLG